MSKAKTKTTKPHRNGHVTRAELKLDLSYGELPANHPYTRLDAVDPFSTDWRLADASVDEAASFFLFQRIPKEKRGPWMDELYRVLKPGAKCLMIVPYYSSMRAIQDPEAEWPPFCEASFYYFNKQFREVNKLPLKWKCDFDLGFGHNLDQETQGKEDSVRAHWVKHYLNAAPDLHVTLTKKV